MTPELVGRVDAWLHARGLGHALARSWYALRGTWAAQREEAFPGEAEATAAAMGGVLLALVREAWPSDGELLPDHEPAWTIREHRGSTWVCGVPGGGQFDGATETEALAAALEAAP